MKYRIFSALMVLAMVASLCVVAAAPASAATPDVTVNAVNLGTNDAGANGVSCDVVITANEQINVGDVITFEFTGFDLSSLDVEVDTNNNFKFFRWVDGVGNDLIGIGDLNVSGNKITVYAPDVITNGNPATLRLFSQALLGNPNISQELDVAGPCGDAAPDNLYEVDVNGDDIAVEIFDHVKVDGSSFAKGDMATVTATGFSPQSTIYVTGGFAGNAEVGSDGTVTFDCMVTGQQVDLMAYDTTGRKACMAWAGNFNLLPSLSITPPDGRVCTPIRIEGYNYPAAPAQITIGGQVWNVGAIGMQDLDGDGVADDFRITDAIIPRTLKSGQYQIVAGAGTTWFTVDSKQVTITPPAGPPGTNITIEGTGFCPTSTEYPDGVPYGVEGFAIMMYGSTTAGEEVADDIIVDDLGNFTVQGKIPGAATPGVHGVMVVFDPDGVFNQSANEVTVQGMFTVTDRDLTIVPESGIPFGTQVTLSGGNFGVEAKGAMPELWVNYKYVPLAAIENFALSSTGDMVPATFVVDTNKKFHYGENIVEVRTWIDTNNDGVLDKEMSAMTTLELDRPTLEITPEQGPRGTKVTAEGSGWLTGMTDFVTIKYERADTGETASVDVVRANENGEIWSQFTVPSFNMDTMDEINLLIWADDAKDNKSLQQTFMVSIPTINVEPDTAAPGEEITVTGEGFQPKTQIQEVSIGNSPIVPIYELGLTDAKGSFEVTGTVPGVMSGGNLVRVRVTQGQNEAITAPFTVAGEVAGDTTVEDAFSEIEGLFTRIWTFDAAAQEWQVYDTAAGAPDDFTTLISGQGYWVEVTEDCTLTYGANTWNLKDGWNLIGWMG